MLIIYGPTGVGKSDFALDIASKIPAEIINMDVGQLYAPLSIGTAKPEWQNQLTLHHLFDIINKPQNYTVVEYRNTVFKLVSEIRQRNALPILVGGSGFYLKSLFFPPHTIPESPQVDFVVPPKEELWETLSKIDPERARQIEPHDTYRIQRALELWARTGHKPSCYKPRYENRFGKYEIIYLTREKEDLCRRINARVIQMFEQGWIEEVESLIDTPWIPFIEKKKLIGYNEIASYVKHNKPSDMYALMVQEIQKRTRNYARRQGIFWRMLEKSFTDSVCDNKDAEPARIIINLTSSDHAIYLKQLLEDRSHFSEDTSHESKQ